MYRKYKQLKAQTHETTLHIPPPPRASSLHMVCEFAEIDLASSMNIETIIVNEEGEEPFITRDLTLFTDDGDESRSTFKQDRDGIEQFDLFGALLLDLLVEERPRFKTNVEARTSDLLED
jgi:hypothetical protein